MSQNQNGISSRLQAKILTVSFRWVGELGELGEEKSGGTEFKWGYLREKKASWTRYRALVVVRTRLHGVAAFPKELFLVNTWRDFGVPPQLDPAIHPRRVSGRFLRS